MSIIIRKAIVDDASDVLQLNKEFNGEKAATLSSTIYSLTYNKQEIVMIAYNDSNPAGFICGITVKSVCYKSNHGHIGELFVAKKYRRMGIGKMLMLAMEDFFVKKGIGIVTLGTSISNTTAQKFYEQCGYLQKDRFRYRKHI